MNEFERLLMPVRHGLLMAVSALLLGVLWAAYLATHHEQLHSGFEAKESAIQAQGMHERMQDMQMDGMSLDHTHASDVAAGNHDHGSNGNGATTHKMHSHSGSLAGDAMQRLLRGHIHFMGVGLLAMIMLLLVAFTSLKPCWKKIFGWTFGLGTLLYPPAWILMGLRTVELGPQAAEASVLWLFGPAVGLLLGSLVMILAVMIVDWSGLKKKPLFSWAFNIA